MNPLSTFEIHSHSTISDGKYSPENVAEMMAEAGVDLWALTDHDTTQGCEVARKAAEDAGIVFVPGIEISAQSQDRSIHVLGYGFDVEAPRLAAYGEKMENARYERMKTMVERMCSLGFEVTIEEVLEHSSEGNIGRPHLAKALVKRGYVDQIQAAFDRWLATGQPGYVEMSWLSVDEAIELITDAGGLVVLAHPAGYGDLSDRLVAWREAGLWGLEVRHPSHDTLDEKRLVAMADRFALGKTASNDWHGNHPEDREKLGKVRFPQSWRVNFVEALRRRTQIGSELPQMNLIK